MVEATGFIWKFALFFSADTFGIFSDFLSASIEARAEDDLRLGACALDNQAVLEIAGKNEADEIR